MLTEGGMLSQRLDLIYMLLRCQILFIILICLTGCTDTGNCDEGEDPSTFTISPTTSSPEIRPVFGALNSPYDSEFIDINISNNLTQNKNIVVEISSTQLFSRSDLTVGDSLDISIDMVDRFTDTLISTITVRSLSEDSGDDCNVPIFKNISVSTAVDTAYGTHNESILIKT